MTWWILVAFFLAYVFVPVWLFVRESRKRRAARRRTPCHVERCTSSARYGPDGIAVACWSHAGDWPEVRS